MATINPGNAVFQGRTGGWPGFPSFTDPTQIYLASPLTVNWKTGPITYTFSSPFAIPAGGRLNLTLFVTLSDPNRNGSAQVFVDTDSSRWSQGGDTFATLGIIQTYVTPSGASGSSSGSSAGGPLSGWIGSLVAALSNVTFPKVYQLNLPTGNNDIYTVPAGRMALVIDVVSSVLAAAPGAVTGLGELKLGPGSYAPYDFFAFSQAAGTKGNTRSLVPFLFFSGETFAINVNGTGMTVWPFIIEFDSTTLLQRALLTSLNIGANTIFTMPAGKTISLMGFPSALQAGGAGYIWYFNGTVSTPTVSMNIVPSGGSPAEANQIFSGAVANGQMAQQPFYGGLGPGDFISVNTSISTSPQTAWITYVLQ